MNKESSLFNPTDLELSRSTFDFHPTRSGTCVAGRLIPAFAFEVLPGDSIKMNLNTLVKMSTPVYPTMDELFMDVAFYFVPNRLILGRRYGSPAVDDANNSWKAFIGAQDNLLNMPVPAEGVILPVVSCDFDSSSIQLGSLADYFCYPDVGAVIAIPCLDTLSYVAIWNENYRDPNTMDPVTWYFQSDDFPNEVFLSGFVPLRGVKDLDYLSGDGVPDYKVANALDMSTQNPVNTCFVSDVRPFPTCRFHDYFGSCLPWPQRNQEGVELPLGDSAPVYPMDDVVEPDELNALRLGEISGGRVQYPGDAANLYIDGDGAGTVVSDGQGSEQPGSQSAQLMPTNLFADLRQATAANINALRLAVQKQRWYEKLARSGNRFDELEYGLFGVRPHDSGDDRPLYLGGKRIPLKIEMVASTNGGDSSSSAEGSGSLGSLGAFSHTNDSDNYFYHSFDEWGTLMCVFTIRHHTTVGDGLSRKYSRITREDYYWPTYAHLGEQAVLVKEINCTGTKSHDDRVFGYQEAWAEYRYEPDRVSGLLRPGRNLDFMTYAESFSDNFSLASFLNASWQVESIDKTLQVKSLASGFQFVYQFNFDFTARRCMPEYSIPGMVDHF